jgi:hypothetical protein
MHVQPHIVWQLLQIRDRDLRERASRAARHADVAAGTPPTAPQRHSASTAPQTATAQTATASC